MSDEMSIDKIISCHNTRNCAPIDNVPMSLKEHQSAWEHIHLQRKVLRGKSCLDNMLAFAYAHVLTAGRMWGDNRQLQAHKICSALDH